MDIFVLSLDRQLRPKLLSDGSKFRTEITKPITLAIIETFVHRVRREILRKLSVCSVAKLPDQFVKALLAAIT